MAKRESGGDFFPDSARNFVQFAGVPMKAVGFPDRDLSPKMKKIVLSGLTTLTLLPSLTAAPALETLLPAETVAVVAVPDYAGAEKNFNAGAIGQLWNSKEMKAFREKFEDGFTDNVLGRIEKQYGIDVEAFEELAAGPVAFGLVAPSAAGQEPGALFLMDAGKKTFTLGRVISRLERDWKKTARKTSRTTIGKIKFTTLIGASERPVLHVGRDKGLFLAGSDAGLLEGVLARNNGKGEGALAANGGFAADNVAVLKGADAYIWANLSAVLPQLINNAPDGAELGINVGEMLSSLGVDGFQSIATTFREQEDGAYFDVFLGLPEAKRTGLLGLMETKKTNSAPPAFVPANVELFQRWRLDMAATWGNLEKLLTDTAPDVASMVEFTVGLLGKDKDQNFDFKKSFFENLGDDIIVFQQPPETKQLETVGAGPVLVLVEAANPDELIKAIGAVPGILPPPLNETPLLPRRLGDHTVYSFGLMEIPDPTTGEMIKMEILFGGKDGYLVAGTNPKLLQAHLDGNTANPLNARAGLTEAAAKVGGLQSGVFGFQNDRSVMQHAAGSLKDNADMLEAALSMIPTDDLGGVGLSDWMDLSLLPTGEVLGRYFDFTVYGAANDARGITLKYFSPRPASLKR